MAALVVRKTPSGETELGFTVSVGSGWKAVATLVGVGCSVWLLRRYYGGGGGRRRRGGVPRGGVVNVPGGGGGVVNVPGGGGGAVNVPGGGGAVDVPGGGAVDVPGDGADVVGSVVSSGGHDLEPDVVGSDVSSGGDDLEHAEI